MPGHFLDVHNRLAHFDGTKLHFTEKFSGERYVIIYYCNNCVDPAPPPARCSLTQLGFNLPVEAFDISRVENSIVESVLVDSVSSATSSSEVQRCHQDRVCRGRNPLQDRYHMPAQGDVCGSAVGIWTCRALRFRVLSPLW